MSNVFNKYWVYGAVLFTVALIVPIVLFAGRPESDKVTICHYAGGSGNYVVQQPAKSADVSGHDRHENDIIPPFDYDGGSYPGKNWTTENQAFWENGCKPNEYENEVRIEFVSDGSEDGDYFQFKFVLGEPTPHDLKIYYSVGGSATNNVDYNELDGTTTISAGNSETHHASNKRKPVDDTLVEGTETVVITITGTNDSDVTIGNQNTETMEIFDNDFFGCTDPEASNYDPKATQDDDSCTSDEEPVYQCSDGIDNDNDGLIDEDDPGCEGPEDNDEYNESNSNPDDGLNKIVAHKIVCESEEDLPNWGKGGNDIKKNTAKNYVDASDGACWFEEGWYFEYGFGDAVSNPGDDYYGTAGGNWSTFGPTNTKGKAIVKFDEYKGNVWFREVLKEGYIPFTFGLNNKSNIDDFSAEFYCHKDVKNYDNFDKIDSPAGGTFYCIAFNVQEEELVDMCPNIRGNQETVPEGYELVDGDCVEIVEPILGCMDLEANNYDSEATQDDDLCTYDEEQPVYGCTDKEAYNYDPEATVDDKSCEYESNDEPTTSSSTSNSGQRKRSVSRPAPQVLGAATSNSCPQFTEYLRLGDRDGVHGISQVAMLQEFLNSHLPYTISVDGTYGTETEYAVRSFQQMNFGDVITPWASYYSPETTGRFYKTTRFKANQLVNCIEPEVWLEDVNMMFGINGLKGIIAKAD